MALTIWQIIVLVCAFALAFWLIDRCVPPGTIKTILNVVVVVLGLLVILAAAGALHWLNTPVLGPGR